MLRDEGGERDKLNRRRKLGVGGWGMEMFCIFTILTVAMATRLHAFVNIYKTVQRGEMYALQTGLI